MYLGLVEDEDYGDYGYDDLAEEEQTSQAPASSRRSRTSSLSRVTDDSQPVRSAVVRAIPTPTSTVAGVHHLHPTDFNLHAQELGDKFRDGAVVIMSLEGTDPEVASRLKNFASGLVYGLRGNMKQVGGNVFLLSPAGIQVSAEEQQRFLETRGLFSQP